ncbi:hypothetical protein F4779DRAFT_152597 [Xylariaceae sp. FL0662B]|nr:hypothetical protein F4779DRAFT_152597 [Xylariaceae sp. FL0662B]
MEKSQAQANDTPCYRVLDVTSHVEDINDYTELRVTSNGKRFYIRICITSFHNSPSTTKTYLKFLEFLHSGEEELDGLEEEYFYEWAITPFLPLFADLAPRPPPAFDPEQIKAKAVQPTLYDYLLPEWALCELSAVDDKLVARQVIQKECPQMLGVRLDSDFKKDLETWTTVYRPSDVKAVFDNPEDARYSRPQKARVDTTNGAVLCFFKHYFPGAYSTPRVELSAYKKMTDAKLPAYLHISRLYGVVLDKDEGLMGILLKYIDPDPDSDGLLSYAIEPDTPDSLRQRWATQVEDSLTKLHEAGIIWGDGKAENVLIDKDHNAWIVDFGGGHTVGWVDPENEGTLAGDFQALARIKDFIFGKYSPYPDYCEDEATEDGA